MDLPKLLLTACSLILLFSAASSSHCAEDLECSECVGQSGWHEDGWSEAPWPHAQIWNPFQQGWRFRHSSLDGRSIGRGLPLRTTSWLNRPYEVGLEVGGFFMASRVNSNNSSNNDVLAAMNLGWDWDHYWGTQARFAWTSPELSSSVTPAEQTTNTLLIYDLSLMYYPWGDSRVRPYYRMGLGLTDLDFTNSTGAREDSTLLTMPLGIGIKYQTERWLAFRAEAVDNIAWGQNSASTMHNFTLTIGFECRYGGRPSSGWSSPSKRGTW